MQPPRRQERQERINPDTDDKKSFLLVIGVAWRLGVLAVDANESFTAIANRSHGSVAKR